MKDFSHCWYIAFLPAVVVIVIYYINYKNENSNSNSRIINVSKIFDFSDDQRYIDEFLNAKGRKTRDISCKRLFQTKELDKWLDSLSGSPRQRRSATTGDSYNTETLLNELLDALKQEIANLEYSDQNNIEPQNKMRSDIASFAKNISINFRYSRAVSNDIQNKLQNSDKSSTKSDVKLNSDSTDLDPNNSDLRTFLQGESTHYSERVQDANISQFYNSRTSPLFSVDPYYKLADTVPSGLLSDLSPVSMSRLSQVKGRYLWTGCTMHEYNYTMARLCAARTQSEQDRPLRITFFGDSRVRQLMGSLFKEIKDDAWKMYLAPRYSPEEYNVMNARLYEELIDYHYGNKNFTWVDRLARAEFNFTESDLYNSHLKKSKELRKTKATMSKNHSIFDDKLNDSLDTISMNFENHGTEESASHEEFNEIHEILVDNTINPSASRNENKSAFPTDIDDADDPLEDEAIQKGLIRLQYHICLYPYWKEMEGSISTLLERLKKYEALPNMDLPAVVVISNIMWEVHTSKREMLSGIDNGVQQLVLARTHLFRVLRNMAARGTTVIWMLLDPVRDNMVKSNGDAIVDKAHPFSDYLVEWFNTVLATVLLPLVREGTLLLWDTGFPLSVRVNQDCRELTKSSPASQKFSESPNWKCFDFLHPGHQSNQVYAQMLLNYACNDIISDVIKLENDDVCCTGV